MKYLILIIVAILIGCTFLFAQTNNGRVSFTSAEFRTGYGISSFGKGLKEKYDAGNFSTSGGFLASLAVYRKFRSIHYWGPGLQKEITGRKCFLTIGVLPLPQNIFRLTETPKKVFMFRAITFLLHSLHRNTEQVQIWNLTISLLLVMALLLVSAMIFLLELNEQQCSLLVWNTKQTTGKAK
jgi:hypothetical protein